MLTSFPPVILSPLEWVSGVDVSHRIASGIEFRIEFIACVAACYLAAVWSLKQLVRWRGAPFQLTKPLAAWNFSLALASGVMLVWLVRSVWHEYSTVVESNWEMACDHHQRLAEGSHLAPLYAVFLSKYLELIDTAFLCLRGKPTPFIHVYHHAITVYFTAMHLSARTCLAWLMSSMNLGVHVLLYTYYGLAVLGVDIWFKRYLTVIQIAQFVATLIPSVVVLGARILFTIEPTMGAPCNGSWFSAIVGSAILLSYLGLFVQLYFARFDSASGADKKRAIKLQQARAVTAASPREGSPAWAAQQASMAAAQRAFDHAKKNIDPSTPQPPVFAQATAPSPLGTHADVAPFVSPTAHFRQRRGGMGGESPHELQQAHQWPGSPITKQ